MARGRWRLGQRPGVLRSQRVTTLPGAVVHLVALLLLIAALYYTLCSSTMGSIVGIVRDTNDTPLEDVNMVIMAGPSHPDIAAITDSYGMFGFDNLRPGNYVLKAFGRVESDDIPVRLIRNKTPFVEIWLDDTSISHGGDVVNEENYFRDESYFREGF